MSNYQEFIFDDKAIFISLDELADHDGKEDSLKHIILLDNGSLRVLTSSSVKVIPDLVQLAKKYSS